MAATVQETLAARDTGNAVRMAIGFVFGLLITLFLFLIGLGIFNAISSMTDSIADAILRELNDRVSAGRLRENR